MEDFGDGSQTFTEGGEAVRLDHEFLEINGGVGVRAAVDDVGHGHGEHLGVGAAEILEERLAEGGGGGFGVCERNGQDGIRAELGLGFGAVQFDQGAVQGQLVYRVQTDDGRGDLAGHVFDGLGDALAEIALLVAVAKFHGFVFAGAGPAGDGGATEGTAVQRNVHFHGGVSA